MVLKMSFKYFSTDIQAGEKKCYKSVSKCHSLTLVFRVNVAADAPVLKVKEHKIHNIYLTWLI